MSEPKISEFRQAVRIANRVLDRHSADPDDDEAIVARQFLRAIEREQERRDADLASYDPYGDLIGSNRDAILEVQTEGFRRVRRLLKLDRVDQAIATIEAVETFHPMHGESWKGWPADEVLQKPPRGLDQGGIWPIASNTGGGG